MYTAKKIPFDDPGNEFVLKVITIDDFLKFVSIYSELIEDDSVVRHSNDPIVCNSVLFYRKLKEKSPNILPDDPNGTINSRCLCVFKLHSVDNINHYDNYSCRKFSCITSNDAPIIILMFCYKYVLAVCMPCDKNKFSCRYRNSFGAFRHRHCESEGCEEEDEKASAEVCKLVTENLCGIAS